MQMVHLLYRYKDKDVWPMYEIPNSDTDIPDDTDNLLDILFNVLSYCMRLLFRTGECNCWGGKGYKHIFIISLFELIEVSVIFAPSMKLDFAAGMLFQRGVNGDCDARNKHTHFVQIM